MESKAIFICKCPNDLKILFSFNFSREQPVSAVFIRKIHFHSVTLLILRRPAVGINKLQKVKGLDQKQLLKRKNTFSEKAFKSSIKS